MPAATATVSSTPSPALGRPPERASAHTTAPASAANRFSPLSALPDSVLDAQPSPAADTQTNNTAPVLRGPVTASNGGTSKGNPAAGTIPSTWSGIPAAGPITTGDKVGAVFLSLILVGIMSSGAIWINME